METANVFNIERFATEDGPGIRTVVFLKGCALNCLWCANPESQCFASQILFNPNSCVGCGRCVKLCPKGCIQYLSEYGYVTKRNCDLCGKCVEGCYVGARSICGKEYTIPALASEILRDESYFIKSGGGVTFSGGEPLYRHQFIRIFAQEMKKRKITTLIETCGHVPQAAFVDIADAVDMIFYDLKHMNPVVHSQLTGFDNQLILSNLKWLSKNFKGILSVRYPYIPGCNDKPEDIHCFLRFVKELENVAEVWFLPYHRLGIPKYQGLGRDYLMKDTKPLRMQDINFLIGWGAKYGLQVRI